MKFSRLFGRRGGQGTGSAASSPVAAIRNVPDPEPAAVPDAAPVAAGESTPVLPRALFNDARYLDQNPDAAALVRDGAVTAFEHYARIGHRDEARGLRPRTLPAHGLGLGRSYHAEDAVLNRLIEAEIEKAALIEAWNANLHRINHIDFDMVSETIDDELVPPLDRAVCDEAALDDDQRAWRRDGYVIKRDFLPGELIDRYVEIRRRHPSPGGWSSPVPYMHVPELRALSLYPPLMALLERLIGAEMCLHLNLTGWVSTDRNWHQDDYLNPSVVNSWYAAVWMALDDIHPDCGPFEFVPGSHRWPVLRGHKVRMYMPPDVRNGDNWPGEAERIVNGVAEEEIERRGMARDKFIAKKGDLLVWHGRTMHRGSYANVPGMQRMALISHYTATSHLNPPKFLRTPDGHAYYDHPTPLDFDPYR